MKASRAAAAGVIVVAALGGDPAEACTCSLLSPAPREMLLEAEAVFVGDVLYQRPGRDGGLVTTFAVERLWKGNLASTLTIHPTGWSCDASFAPGKRYLVYAFANGEKLYSHLCSSKPLWRAATDVLLLPEPIHPFPVGGWSPPLDVQSVPAETLIGRLSSSSPKTRLRGLLALGHRPDVLPKARRELATLLVSGSEEERRTALDALRRTGEAGAVVLPELVRGLKDPSPVIRVGSAEALGTIGPKAAVASPDLLMAIRTGRLEVDRAHAVASIGSGVDEAVTLFRSWLDREDPNVRARGLRGLSAIGPAASDTVPELTECLDDPESLVQIAAVEALGAIGAPARAAAPRLVDKLENEPALSWVAVEALVRMDSTQPVIDRILDGRVPVEWAESLSGESVATLATGLSSGESEVRVRAIRALAAVGRSRSPGDLALVRSILVHLDPALHDVSASVRSEAAAARAELEPFVIEAAVSDRAPKTTRAEASSFGSGSTRTWLVLRFIAAVLVSSLLVRRQWFLLRGGRGSRLLMSAALSLAILWGYELVQAFAR